MTKTESEKREMKNPITSICSHKIPHHDSK